MEMFCKMARDFLRSIDGTTTTEYAVILALIILACFTAIILIGTKLTTIFANVNRDLPINSPPSLLH